MVKPLVCSLLVVMTPLLYITYEKDMMLLSGLLLAMIFVGYEHHNNFCKNDVWHKVDKCLCWVLIVYTAILNMMYYKRCVYWVCLIVVGMCYYVELLYCDNQENEKRNWTNVYQLIPHAMIHIATGVGISKMLN